MSKKMLLSIVVLLLITNIATLLFWNKDGYLLLDGESGKINSNKEVASVDGKKILYKDWQRSLQESYGKGHLKALIDQSVVKQLAKQANISIHEKVIERELLLLTTMQGVMTEDEILVQKEKWRENILYRYQLEALLTEGITIPEGELQLFYEGYEKQYDFEGSMQFSHIVVQDEATAEQVIQELIDGASFRLLAQEYSLDEETKNDGGYLGYHIKGSQFLPYGYDEVASKMEPHSFSEAFKVDNGVAILYLHQSLPSVTFTYEEIKPYIQRELALEKLGQSLEADSLWDKLDIKWVYEE